MGCTMGKAQNAEVRMTMTIQYGQTIEWSHRGSKLSVTVNGCATPQEALGAAIRNAKLFGWTPPRWWQWWRWSEPIRTDSETKDESR